MTALVRNGEVTSALTGCLLQKCFFDQNGLAVQSVHLEFRLIEYLNLHLRKASQAEGESVPRQMPIVDGQFEQDGEQTGYEGCLSLPGKTGIVTRPNHVKAVALDRDMNPIEIEGEGLLARAICHELEHLDGHLYTERLEGELMDTESLADDDDEDEEEIPEEE